MTYLSTQQTINEYKAIRDTDEFPTLRDYCLYACGGDFTAFDDCNTLANEMMNDDLLKGIPIC